MSNKNLLALSERDAEELKLEVKVFVSVTVLFAIVIILYGGWWIVLLAFIAMRLILSYLKRRISS